jgi:hypothetical protein
MSETLGKRSFETCTSIHDRRLLGLRVISDQQGEGSRTAEVRSAGLRPRAASRAQPSTMRPQPLPVAPPAVVFGRRSDETIF